MAIENLIENVDSQIIKIRTKSLDISFNELYDMYQTKELTISPDYQRLFRWGGGKAVAFCGIPDFGNAGSSDFCDRDRGWSL